MQKFCRGRDRARRCPRAQAARNSSVENRSKNFARLRTLPSAERGRGHRGAMSLPSLTLAVAALVASCGKPDSPGTKPGKASVDSRTETGAPVEVVTSSGMAMISLPGGEFVMGSDKGNPDEAPPHKVKVSA